MASAPPTQSTSTEIDLPLPWLNYNGEERFDVERSHFLRFHRCLNIKSTDLAKWTPAKAFSALVENVVEGILQWGKLKYHELRVEERQFCAGGGRAVEFFLYRADCPSLASEGTKRPHLGYIAWRPREDAPDDGIIELWNVGEITSDAVWKMGFTTKSSDADLAGQYGKGAKLAGAALLRGPSERLFYHSGKMTWDFTLNSKKYGYHTREVFNRYLGGVLTQISHLPWADTDFDRFLLLRPPISTLPDTSAGRVKAKLGWVLLDERHHHKIFVKGAFIRAEDDSSVGLRFGYNFVHGVAVNCDRDELVDSSPLSTVIYKTWEPLLLTSSQARQHYIDMLFDHEKCLDVSGLRTCITRPVAVILFEALKQKYGPRAFFYYSDETTEAKRIIETSLKRRPVLLKELLWDSLRQWPGLVMTPSEARQKRFRDLPEYPIDISNRAETDILHTVRSFLLLDERTERFLDRWIFKACPADSGDVECSMMPEGELHLSDRLLRPEYVHNKLNSSTCLIDHAPSRGTGSAVIRCHCAALYISALVVDEIQECDAHEKGALKAAQRDLASQMPRHVSFVFDESGENSDNVVTFRWEAAMEMSDFILWIRSAEDHSESQSPCIFRASDDADPVDSTDDADMDIDDQPHEERGGHHTPSRGSEEFTSVHGSSIDMQGFQPAEVYTIQVRRDCDLAIWSPPIHLTIPGNITRSASSSASPPPYENATPSLGPSPDIMDVHEDRPPSPDVQGGAMFANAETGARAGPRRPTPPELHNTQPESPSKNTGTIQRSGGDSALEPQDAITFFNDLVASPRQSALFRADLSRTRIRIASRRKRTKRTRKISHYVGPVAVGGEQGDGGDVFEPDPDEVGDDGEAADDYEYEPSAEDRDDLSIWQLGMDETIEGDKDDYMMIDDESPALAHARPSPIDARKFCAGHSYEISFLHGRKNARRSAIIQVLENATYEGTSRSRATLRVIRYIHASDYFKSTPLPNTLGQVILLHQEIPEDGIVWRALAEDFPSHSIIEATEVTIVYPESSHISHEPPAPEGKRTWYICHWTIAADGIEDQSAAIYRLPPGPDWADILLVYIHPEVAGLPILPPYDNPSLYENPSTLDIFAGTGGSSRGFEDAGFKIIGAVENNRDAANSWKSNFPHADIHYEEVEIFLNNLSSDTIRLSNQVTILLASPPCQPFSKANVSPINTDIKNIEQLQMVARAVSILRPAYLFLEEVDSLLYPAHRKYFEALLVALLQMGYSIRYMVLNAADYGVATTRKRLITLAAARGLYLPARPKPTHRDPEYDYEEPAPSLLYVTVEDAIRDLEWRNPRIDARAIETKKYKTLCNIPQSTNCREPSDYALSLGCQTTGLISHHITGRKANESWDRQRTLGEYNRPLTTILTTPTDRWKCRHPRFQDQIMSPRELGRIMSFPDQHRFSGPLGAQYRQIGNAVPPLLAKAVALEIRAVLKKLKYRLEYTWSPQASASMAKDEHAESQGRAQENRRKVTHDGLEEAGRAKKRFRAAPDP